MLKLRDLVLYPFFAPLGSVLDPVLFQLLDRVKLLLLIVVELGVNFCSLLLGHFVLDLLDLLSCDLIFLELFSFFEGGLKRAAILEVLLLAQ